VATTNAPGVSTPPEVKEALLAYIDALALAEPIQARLWQEAEITLTQLSVLRELRAGPQNAGRLGHRVGHSPASMSRLLDRLERRGLVSRHRNSEDRRVVEVHLEPAGERLLGQMTLFRGSGVHRAFQAMASEERRVLTNLLRRLVATTRDLVAQEEIAE
jgi:MarR family 2-MHQ and catechol resistance regulon transcriptional repressor